MAADTATQGPQAPTQDPGIAPEQEIPLKERIDTAVAVVYGRSGRIDADGSPNLDSIADEVEEIVLGTKVEKPTDRVIKRAHRTEIMAKVWPDIPGKEAWSEQEDPELAAGVYGRLDGDIWRMLAPDESGLIQTRLASTGYVLCRWATGSKKSSPLDSVYITRNKTCLVDDYAGPLADQIRKLSDRLAANLAHVAMHRVPEHARALERVRERALQDALDAGAVITRPELEAAREAAAEAREAEAPSIGSDDGDE